MSELINPDIEMMPDVPEGIESVIEEASQPAVNYSEKNLAELVKLFEELVQNEERMKRSKDAEAIKSAFYKRLQKEKADAGIVAVEASETEAETENPDIIIRVANIKHRIFVMKSPQSLFITKFLRYVSESLLHLLHFSRRHG